MVLAVKNLPASAWNVRDLGLMPGSGRSPTGRHGNPFQYFAGRISWTEEPGGLQSMGFAKELDVTERRSTYTGWQRARLS